MSQAWPDAMSARATEARDLSRLLGEDHDIAVLLGAAQERAKPSRSNKDVKALIKVGRARQEELRSLAKPRGTRLFAQPAEDLSAQIALYWTCAEHIGAPEESARKPAKKPAISGR
jgi:hypothetical protein